MLREFLARYGERGYLVLKAIVEEADRNWGEPRLGDFSFKGVRSRIRGYGVEYNPAPLLSKLEKEYGVIETTYRSSTQHWWRIVDRDSLIEALRVYEGSPEGELDARARLLRIQFYSLDPERILEVLRRAGARRRLSDYDRRRIRRIVFEDLPLVVRFLEEAEGEYEDLLAREIALAHAILDAAEKLVSPGVRPARGGGFR
ncbi:MAG: hypothetical protein GSR86_05695, partial [Desulfurococcales archaeon]|nr:hypothetical protein [Desulfurococcales archaeon]